MTELIPLSCLLCGQSAQVESVLGQADLVHRLDELGLRSGVVVEMLQPGSASIIRLAGHKLCIRGDDLLSVLVRPQGSLTP